MSIITLVFDDRCDRNMSVAPPRTFSLGIFMQVFNTQFRLSLERTRFIIDKTGQICSHTETVRELDLLDKDVIRVIVITDNV